MITITGTSQELVRLGMRLRAARIVRDEPMQLFAQRIGISVPTLRAMERGADTVQIKHWANALWALDRLQDLTMVLASADSPLDLARQHARQKPPRQRARRRTV
jgi:transcriptional regulator with XRE-family HTH domain